MRRPGALHGSGTEATFFALRIARAKTGRDKVLKFEGGWHGMHDYGLWGTVPSQPSAYPRAEPDSIGMPPEAGGRCWSRRSTTPSGPSRLIEEHAHELAAVIVEPLQRVLLPVPGFLRGGARRHDAPRHRARLRRDRDRLPHRLGRRAGEVRRRARSGDATARRCRGGFPMAAIAGRADVMARPRCAAQRPRAQRGVGERHAERQPGVRHRRAARRWTCWREPGVYDRLHEIGGRLRARHRASRRAARLRRAGARRGRGVRRSLHGAPSRCARGRTSLTADKNLGYRWAIGLLKRGILVNPEREVLHLDRAHRRGRDAHARDRRRGVRGNQGLTAADAATYASCSS